MRREKSWLTLPRRGSSLVFREAVAEAAGAVAVKWLCALRDGFEAPNCPRCWAVYTLLQFLGEKVWARLRISCRRLRTMYSAAAAATRKTITPTTIAAMTPPLTSESASVPLASRFCVLGWSTAGGREGGEGGGPLGARRRASSSASSSPSPSRSKSASAALQLTAPASVTRAAQIGPTAAEAANASLASLARAAAAGVDV